MFGMSGRVSSVLALLVVGGLLVGCSSTPLNRAPVVDRGATVAGSTPVVMDPNTPLVKQPQGFENAGKPGYYTVKPGDTMTRIGLETGHSPKDIARWSGVENPHKIEVGQVLACGSTGSDIDCSGFRCFSARCDWGGHSASDSGQRHANWQRAATIVNHRFTRAGGWR